MGEDAGTLVNETTASQLASIRAHLERYGVIGAREARELYGCERLGARIWDLRHLPDDAMNIRTEKVNGKNRFGRPCSYALYYLDEQASGGRAAEGVGPYSEEPGAVEDYPSSGASRHLPPRGKDRGEEGETV